MEGSLRDPDKIVIAFNVRIPGSIFCHLACHIEKHFSVTGYGDYIGVTSNQTDEICVPDNINHEAFAKASSQDRH